MAYAKATLVSRIRRELNDVPWFDAAAAAVTTAGQTTLTVADTTLYAVGDVIEFQDDGEQVLVQALFSATVLTIARGHNGTTPSTHLISTQLAKGPLFQYKQIEFAVEASLQSLWPSVYHVASEAITPVAGTKWYANATTPAGIDLISAVQMSTSTPSTPFFYGARKGAYPIALVHGLPTASFTSGSAYYIPHFRNTTNTVLIRSAAIIDDTVSGSNYSYLSDGLLVEAVVLLAAADLLQFLDIPRSSDQDTTMADATVSPGARSSVAEGIRRRGMEKKRQYALELARRAPRMPVWAGVSSGAGI